LALLDNLWLFAYDCLDPLQFFCHFSIIDLSWTNKVRISEDSICYDLGDLISCAMSCHLKKIWVFLKMAFVWKFLFCLGIGQTFLVYLSLYWNSYETFYFGHVWLSNHMYMLVLITWAIFIVCPFCTEEELKLLSTFPWSLRFLMFCLIADKFT